MLPDAEYSSCTLKLTLRLQKSADVPFAPVHVTGGFGKKSCRYLLHLFARSTRIARDVDIADDGYHVQGAVQHGRVDYSTARAQLFLERPLRMFLSRRLSSYAADCVRRAGSAVQSSLATSHLAVECIV